MRARAHACVCADAVLDNVGELRLHLKLNSLSGLGPSCVFKAPVDIADNGWSRIELSITGIMASLKFNGKDVGM